MRLVVLSAQLIILCMTIRIMLLASYPNESPLREPVFSAATAYHLSWQSFAQSSPFQHCSGFRNSSEVAIIAAEAY
jgi:hypothetical protein